MVEKFQSSDSLIARLTLRCGDIPRGMTFSMQLKDSLAIEACATVLEEMKQFQDSGILWEKISRTEKACEMFVKGFLSCSDTHRPRLFTSLSSQKF